MNKLRIFLLLSSGLFRNYPLNAMVVQKQMVSSEQAIQKPLVEQPLAFGRATTTHASTITAQKQAISSSTLGRTTTTQISSLGQHGATPDSSFGRTTMTQTTSLGQKQTITQTTKNDASFGRATTTSHQPIFTYKPSTPEKAAPPVQVTKPTELPLGGYNAPQAASLGQKQNTTNDSSFGRATITTHLPTFSWPSIAPKAPLVQKSTPEESPFIQVSKPTEPLFGATNPLPTPSLGQENKPQENKPQPPSPSRPSTTPTHIPDTTHSTEKPNSSDEQIKRLHQEIAELNERMARASSDQVQMQVKKLHQEIAELNEKLARSSSDRGNRQVRMLHQEIAELHQKIARASSENWQIRRHHQEIAELYERIARASSDYEIRQVRRLRQEIVELHEKIERASFNHNRAALATGSVLWNTDHNYTLNTTNTSETRYFNLGSYNPTMRLRAIGDRLVERLSMNANRRRALRQATSLRNVLRCFITERELAGDPDTEVDGFLEVARIVYAEDANGQSKLQTLYKLYEKDPTVLKDGEYWFETLFDAGEDIDKVDYDPEDPELSTRSWRRTIGERITQRLNINPQRKKAPKKGIFASALHYVLRAFISERDLVDRATEDKAVDGFREDVSPTEHRKEALAFAKLAQRARSNKDAVLVTLFKAYEKDPSVFADLMEWQDFVKADVSKIYYDSVSTITLAQRIESLDRDDLSNLFKLSRTTLSPTKPNKNAKSSKWSMGEKVAVGALAAGAGLLCYYMLNKDPKNIGSDKQHAARN